MIINLPFLKTYCQYLQELYPNATSELHYKNPYQFLLAVVLSAQTTDKQVNIATESLFQKVKTPEDLIKYSLKEVETFIQTINYYHNKAKYLLQLSQQLMEMNTKKKKLTTWEHEQKTKFGRFIPEEQSELISLSGVGVKTASVIQSELLGYAIVAVDTHVHRVMNRLGFVHTKTPKETAKAIEDDIPRHYKHILNTTVLFGRYQCKSKNPHCNTCKLQTQCLRYQTQEKSAKSKPSKKVVDIL